VTANAIDTGLTRSAKTGTDGYYTFPALQLGRYTLTAEAPGFQTFSETSIVLHVQEQVRIDIAMRVGRVSEKVVVSGATPLVDTVNATTSAVIGNQQVVELPLNGRNFNALAILSPGVNPGVPGATLQNFLAGNIAVWAYGQKDTSNEWNIDGATMNVGFYNWNSFNPSVDAIQEFKLQTGMYSAQFGFESGANVNIALKSGTNRVHGTLFDFLRNNDITARNFFTATVPKLVQNQFGGTVGGPIYLPKIYNGKDKTFFFFDYERLQSLAQSLVTAVLPSAAQRNGDLSKTYTGAAFTGTIVDPTTGLPFQGNLIPPGRIPSQVPKLLSFYPLPNVPGQTVDYSVLASLSTTTTEYAAKVDHRLSDADTMFVHYVQDYRYRPGAGLPSFYNYTTLGAHNVAVSETHIFSPRTLNQLEVAVNRSYITQITPRFGTNFNLSQTLGIPITTQTPKSAAFPSISVQGFTGWGDPTNYPLVQPDTVIQATDNLTLVRGHHTLNTGLDIRRQRSDRFQGLYTGGQFTFVNNNVVGTGNAFADFLLGLPEATTIGVAPAQIRMRNNRLALYLQDDWSVSPKLTLNLGLRYELNTVVSDTRGTVANFDFAKGVPIPLAPGQGFYPSHPHDFAPRVTFAYRPLASNKLVIRGGYGIYDNSSILLALIGPSNNPPYATSAANFSGVGAPALTFSTPFPSTAASIPANPSYSGLTSDFGPGYTQSRSLDIQYQFTPNTLLELGYTGSFTLGEDIDWYPNAALPGPGAVQPRRPFPNYGSIKETGSVGKGWYNGLTIRVERRLAKGLMFQSAYTWSKTMDYAYSSIAGQPGDQSTPQNPRDISGGLRGISVGDIPKRSVTNFVYTLPFGPGQRFLSRGGVEGKVVGGWQLSGIGTFQSGEVFGVTVAGDSANIGGPGYVHPNRLRNGMLPSSQRTLAHWFDTSAFVAPPAYTFGNAGHDILRGPGYADVDAALMKHTKITETTELEFRAEFYNLPNNVNFGLPGNAYGTSTFGVITGANSPRIIQFGLKLLF
jgi:hypothetical protein